MMPGNTVRLKTWKHYEPVKKGEDGLRDVTFKVPEKGKVAVFLFMGLENQDGSGPQIAPDEWLESMGWKFGDA